MICFAALLLCAQEGFCGMIYFEFLWNYGREKSRKQKRKSNVDLEIQRSPGLRPGGYD